MKAGLQNVIYPFWSLFNAKRQRRKGAKRERYHFFFFAPLRLCLFALNKLQKGLSKFQFVLKLLATTSIILLFTGCQRAGLDVQNQYISYQDLASYRVGTPDWRKECPDYGQRILISWNIRECCCPGELTLRLYLQFGNFEDELIEKSCRSRGNFTYELINCDYAEKKGIASYKVEICCDGEPIKTLKHLLWVEKINLSPTNCNLEPKQPELLLPQVEPNAPIAPPPSEL